MEKQYTVKDYTNYFTKIPVEVIRATDLKMLKRQLNRITDRYILSKCNEACECIECMDTLYYIQELWTIIAVNIFLSQQRVMVEINGKRLGVRQTRYKGYIQENRLESIRINQSMLLIRYQEYILREADNPLYDKFLEDLQVYEGYTGNTVYIIKQDNKGNVKSKERLSERVNELKESRSRRKDLTLMSTLGNVFGEIWKEECRRHGRFDLY